MESRKQEETPFPLSVKRQKKDVAEDRVGWGQGSGEEHWWDGEQAAVGSRTGVGSTGGVGNKVGWGAGLRREQGWDGM